MSTLWRAAGVSALVLYGTFASMKGEPWGVTPDVLDRFLGALQGHWGEGALLQLNAPSRRDDPAFVEHFSRIERAAASPGSVRALMRANYDIEVRGLLPTIRVPTPDPASRRQRARSSPGGPLPNRPHHRIPVRGNPRVR